jgi:hypothetical protein
VLGFARSFLLIASSESNFFRMVCLLEFISAGYAIS